MSALPVRYFDGQTARPQEAWLSPIDGGLVLSAPGLERAYRFADITLHPRLGHSAPSIDLPDGGQLLLLQADLPDWLGQRGAQPFWAWLHKLESHWPTAVLCLLLVIAASAGLMRYGIPALAKGVAFSLPRETDELLGRHTLAFLDEHMLGPSTLAAVRQQQLSTSFAQLTAGEGLFRLVFRDGEGLGANAFALPDGTVVMTDQLVALSRDDRELLAVLAHEAGHIKYRHSLRLVLAGSATAVLVATLTGDLNSASDTLSSGLPTLLSHSHYSQSFERESDAYARELMLKRGIPLHFFADILSRLEAEHGGDGEQGRVESYLSTHPATAERIKPFRSGG